jgi:hypothetical protein
MKRVMAIGIVVAVLAFLAARPQAAVQVNESINLDAIVFVPCANDGAGELVHLSGPLHVLITFTINGNNVSGKTHFQPQGVSGVGLTTGDKYQGTGVTQDKFKDSLQNDQFEETFIDNFRLIGQGPGNNFLSHETFHVTINANGDVTVVHDNLSIECR